MRIIGGTAGGRRLHAPRGSSTRPTADRVRQAVFNILAARGPVAERVLDLYAGTGALGLEALSRGAREALFVDEDRDACALIEKNARALGFEPATRVHQARALDWLRRAEGRFGWVFLDPPYARDELDRALDLIAARGLAELAIAEHDWRRAPAPQHGRLALSDSRRYGQTAVSFFEESA